MPRGGGPGCASASRYDAGVCSALLVFVLLAPAGERVDFRGGVADRVRLLRHRNPAVRAKAAQLLGTAPADKAIAGLIVALRDPDHGVRRTAADALRRLDDERAVPFLVARLKEEKQPTVLAFLLLAAGTCGDTYVGRRIRPFLEHPARAVRLSAAAALGHVGDSGQRDALWAALRFAPDDPGFTVRTAILGAFVRLGWKADAARAIDELIRAGARRHWASRAGIVAAVGGAGLADRVAYVRRELYDGEDPRVVAAAASSLAQLGHADEVHALLKHETPIVRRAALAALHDAGDERAVPAALRMVKSDADRRTRFEAALVLDRDDHPDADLYLLDALRSKNALYWITALQALERRHDREFGRDPGAWAKFLREQRR